MYYRGKKHVQYNFWNFRTSLISSTISRKKSTEYYYFILTDYNSARQEVYSVKLG